MRAWVARWLLPLVMALQVTGCAAIRAEFAYKAPPQATGLQGELVRLAVPTTVYVDCALEQDEQTGVREAAEYWNRATGLDLLHVEVECDIPDAAYENLETSMVVVRYLDQMVHDPRPGHEHYREMAATHLDTDHGLIYHAMVSLYRSFREDGLGSRGASVLRHEFGHVLGLDHTDDPRCLMYFSTTWDTPGVPSPACSAEVDLVRSIYGGR